MVWRYIIGCNRDVRDANEMRKRMSELVNE